MILALRSAASFIVALTFFQGLGVYILPDIPRIAVSFLALFIVPGFALRNLFFRSRTGLVQQAAEVFVLGSVFASAVTCVGFIPGASFGLCSAVSAICTLILVWLSGKKEIHSIEALTESCDRSSSRSKARFSFRLLLLPLAFAICFVALQGRGELGIATDAPDHLSFIRRSIESGKLFPHDSFYSEGDGISLDPRKGLWHPVLAGWARAAAVSPETLWKNIPSFTAFFALCAFYGFSSVLLGSNLLAFLSTVLLLVFASGEGFPWLSKIAFSRNMVLVMFWTCTVFTISYCRSAKKFDLVAALAISAAGTAFHLSFALFWLSALVSILIFVLVDREGRAWRKNFSKVATATVAAFSLPVVVRFATAVPVYNSIHRHLQGVLFLGNNFFTVDPAEIATRFGPAFFFAIVVAPFYRLLSYRKALSKLVLIMFLVPTIAVLFPFTATVMERFLGYLFYRTLDAATVFCLIAATLWGSVRVVLSGARWHESGKKNFLASGLLRVLAFAAIAMFFWWPARLAIGYLIAEQKMHGKDNALAPRYEALYKLLNDRLPPRSIIASDPRTSYLISAFTDHFIVATLDQHCSPCDTLALERLEATRDLFSPAVPARESVDWLVEKSVRYVLLDEEAPEYADFFGCIPKGGAIAALEKFESCPELFTPIVDELGFHLFEVRSSQRFSSMSVACGIALDSYEDCRDIESEPICDVSMLSEEPMVVTNSLDVGSGIAFTGAKIENPTLRNIDTLCIRFCWQAKGTIKFGFPLELVIRLDGPKLQGRFYRDWYGKQYRRFVERRTGRLRRLTLSMPLRSGAADADLWPVGKDLGQSVRIPLSSSLAPGIYELRVKVRRKTYLPVRTIADYLMNDDSLQGNAISAVYVQ